jgi:hypothetical protein
MRNEAMFVLEWVAYQLVCGFDTVAVVTNDCTDGTDTILDQLAEADDRILHLRNEMAPGEAPQVAGMRKVFEEPRLVGADWLLHCDADEFLHVSCGAGRVQDLLRKTGEADCIALAWRPFGDNDLHEWAGGLVTDKFRRADAKIRPSTALHKSLFRPARFGRAIDHMPKDPVAEDIVLKNSAGAVLDPVNLYHAKHARYRGLAREDLTWENACIHHYAIRSRDLFLMKNLRGDGMARETTKYYLESTFYRRYNRNNVEVEDAVQHLPATRRVVQELRQIGEIALLEGRAFRAFKRQRWQRLTEAQIREWTYLWKHEPLPDWADTYTDDKVSP